MAWPLMLYPLLDDTTASEAVYCVMYCAYAVSLAGRGRLIAARLAEEDGARAVVVTV